MTKEQLLALADALADATADYTHECATVDELRALNEARAALEAK